MPPSTPLPRVVPVSPGSFSLANNAPHQSHPGPSYAYISPSPALAVWQRPFMLLTRTVPLHTGTANSHTPPARPPQPQARAPTHAQHSSHQGKGISSFTYSAKCPRLASWQAMQGRPVTAPPILISHSHPRPWWAQDSHIWDPAQLHPTTVAIPFPDLEDAEKGDQNKSGKKRAKRKGKGVRQYQAKIAKRTDHS